MPLIPASLVAWALDVDPSQVRRWVRDGRLTPHGSPRKPWFDLAQVQELDKTRRKHADRGKKLAKIEPVCNADSGASCPQALPTDR